MRSAFVAAIATVLALHHVSAQPPNADAVAMELLTAVNDMRAQNNKPLLCINTKLMSASQRMANDMAARGAVTTVGADGSQPTDRAIQQGFNTTGVWEIVGAGYNNVSHAMDEWLTKPDFAPYVLSDLAFLGVGYTNTDAQPFKTFWVLDFANGNDEWCG
ncbi:hypothetical protein P43SY_003690 [Pythium insidiosum]|uniref:SCP domain-containing protein n=1 Tax=Pythium insidiosum TaxID=114742 RepID=A0AAD5Q818_PYTIN|nr:hypothetical protein P43SY_003690 [Pythium insidiosum]